MHAGEFLASTFHQFGYVTGLVTNCSKSQVAPIRLMGLDLDHILHAFPANRTNFPMKYLGLPLSITRLKRIHFQPLEDKVAAKLVPWLGKHATMAGRATMGVPSGWAEGAVAHPDYLRIFFYLLRLRHNTDFRLTRIWQRSLSVSRVDEQATSRRTHFYV